MALLGPSNMSDLTSAKWGKADLAVTSRNFMNTRPNARAQRASCACGRRRWRSRSARPSSCSTTRTLSGSSAISIRRRRPSRLSATTAGRAGDVAVPLVEGDALLQPLLANCA